MEKEIADKEKMNKILLTIATKNLSKEVNGLHNKNYETIMKKTIKHKKIFRHPFTYKEKLLL
jgi:hypothetical protein